MFILIALVNVTRTPCSTNSQSVRAKVAEDVAVTNHVGDSVYHFCRLHYYHCVCKSMYLTSLVPFVRLIHNFVFVWILVAAEHQCSDWGLERIVLHYKRRPGVSHSISQERNFDWGSWCHRIGYAVPGFCTLVLIMIIVFEGQSLDVSSHVMLIYNALSCHCSALFSHEANDFWQLSPGWHEEVPSHGSSDFSIQSLYFDYTQVCQRCSECRTGIHRLCEI